MQFHDSSCKRGERAEQNMSVGNGKTVDFGFSVCKYKYYH